MLRLSPCIVDRSAISRSGRGTINNSATPVFRTMLTTLCSLFVFAVSCPAQTLDPAQQLRDYGSKMVGGTWHQSLPENVTNKHTYMWALGNQFLIVHMLHEKNPNALAIVGIDPDTNLQTWWNFQGDGSVRISSVDVKTLSPTKDRIELAGPNPIESGTFDVIWKDKNNTLELIPQPGAQREGDDANRETWKRSDEVDDLSWIDSKEPDKVPQQLSFERHFTGRKWIDGVMPDGSKIVGGGYGKWILGGKFHIFTGSTACDDQTTWSQLVIVGIDPQTDKAAAWEFTSLGAKSYMTYDESGATIYGANTRSNGDKYSFEGHFSVDGDVLRYRSKIGQKGEEPLPYGWNFRDAK